MVEVNARLLVVLEGTPIGCFLAWRKGDNDSLHVQDLRHLWAEIMSE